MTADDAVEKRNKLANDYINCANFFHICTKLSFIIKKWKDQQSYAHQNKSFYYLVLRLCGCMFEWNQFQKLKKYDSESLSPY